MGHSSHFCEIKIEQATHSADDIVIFVGNCRESLSLQVVENLRVIDLQKGFLNVALQLRGQVRTQGPGVLRKVTAVAQHLDLAPINQTAVHHMLEDNFGQPSGVGIAIGDVNRNSVMATDEMSLIVLSGFELCLLKEYGLEDQVAGSGCAVTVGQIGRASCRGGVDGRAV